MVEKGKIIFLSGLTSTGKTSICKELERRKQYSYFILGFDLFEETIPEWSYTDERYAKAIIAMYYAAKSFSDQGQDVIIDGLIMIFSGLDHHYALLKEIFEGYPLIIINVHSDMNILRQRNIERGDRRENQSEMQSLCVDKDVKYDYHINSGIHNIEECTDMLIHMIDFSILTQYERSTIAHEILFE